jgi:fructokinase
MKLLSFGEIIWDVYENEKIIGGAPLNLSCHAALYGFDSYIVSSVGNDELGCKALESLGKFGVKTELVKVNYSLPTGECKVKLNDYGIPSYSLAPLSAYDEISLTQVQPLKFDVICFGTLALRGAHNRESLKNIIENNKFQEIYADLNIRAPYYSKETVEFCLSTASIVKISSEELPIVAELLLIEYNSYEEAALKILNLFSIIKLLIITLGEDGSFCVDSKTQKIYYEDAVKAKVVSTVGAGDSFGAAFLASFLKNHDIASALKIASRISAYVVSSIEAIPNGVKAIFDNI